MKLQKQRQRLLDLDGDGNKKDMKKAAKDAGKDKKGGKLKKGEVPSPKKNVKEGAEEEATLVMVLQRHGSQSYRLDGRHSRNANRKHA